MTILELFLKCNKINVLCAFEKLFPYEQYDWLNSRNFPNIFKRNNYLSFVIDDIKDKFISLSGEITSKNIVYIIENQSTNIEDKTTNFYILHIEKPKEKFNISQISNMCLMLTDDEEKNRKLLNTPISTKSIKEYGVDICATIILHELILFGYKKEDIARNQESLFEKLKESEKDIEEGNYITMEEMEDHLNNWKKELYESANKYEKALLKANDLKDDYLETIKEEYREEKMKENIQYIESFVNEDCQRKDDIDEKLEHIANMLNGRQYLKETTKEIIAYAIENNILICLGASDDLLELLGIIDDEYGACDGVTVYINPQTKKVSLTKSNDYPYFVEAKWCETKDCSWTFDTNLRHKTFNIMEDDELYCVGIVCYLE